MLSNCGSQLDNVCVPPLSTAVLPGPKVWITHYLVSQKLRVDALEKNRASACYPSLNAPPHSGSWCCQSFREFVQTDVTDGPLWTPLP